MAWFNIRCTAAFLRDSASSSLAITGGSFPGMEIGVAFCKYNYTIPSWTFQRPLSGCVRLAPGNHEADWGHSHTPTGQKRAAGLRCGFLIKQL